MRYRSIVALLAVGVAWSQEPTVAELKGRVEQVRQEIAQEEKLWAEEKGREQEAEKRRQERYASFSKEKQELQQAIAVAEQQIAGHLSKIESMSGQKSSMEREFKGYSAALLEQSNAFGKWLETSYPWQLEKRLEASNLVSSDLRQEKISPEEAFARLWALYGKEIAMASEAEVFSGENPLSKTSQVQVKFIRVGKQFLAYSDPTGARMGWYRPSKEGWRWISEEQMDFSTRNAVRNAVAIAEGKAVPGFAPVPVWLEDLALAEAETAQTSGTTPAAKEKK